MALQVELFRRRHSDSSKVGCFCIRACAPDILYNTTYSKTISFFLLQNFSRYESATMLYACQSLMIINPASLHMRVEPHWRANSSQNESSIIAQARRAALKSQQLTKWNWYANRMYDFIWVRRINIKNKQTILYGFLFISSMANTELNSLWSPQLLIQVQIIFVTFNRDLSSQNAFVFITTRTILIHTVHTHVFHSVNMNLKKIIQSNGLFTKMEWQTLRISASDIVNTRSTEYRALTPATKKHRHMVNVVNHSDGRLGSGSIFCLRGTRGRRIARRIDWLNIKFHSTHTLHSTSIKREFQWTFQIQKYQGSKAIKILWRFTLFYNEDGSFSPR